VLVIDDEPTVRDLMHRSLAKDGFGVLLAPGGEEGIRLAREAHPDAITLDVMMPGMDGWAVLTALKADPEVRDIPVVMITIVDDRGLGFALGADEYLTKPIDRERLLRVLERFRRDPTVLVVDDDAEFRQLLVRTLAGAGYVAIEAGNGVEALDQVRREAPGLILLDLMMPQMDGFEVVRQLRASPATHDVPVLVMTSLDLTPADHERLNGSVARVLAKGATARDALLREAHDLLVTSITRRRRAP
jgi:CheY-like chemotaxis protein